MRGICPCIWSRNLRAASREHATVAVMVCDLNGFKQINDRYGHLAGDKVLKIFANLIREVCREYDYAARMGGDEFVIVAPNMTPGSVSERATLFSALATTGRPRSVQHGYVVSEHGSGFLPAGWGWTRSSFWRRPTEECTRPSSTTTRN